MSEPRARTAGKSAAKPKAPSAIKAPSTKKAAEAAQATQATSSSNAAKTPTANSISATTKRRKAPAAQGRSLRGCSPEERYRYVSQAAYFRALRRGFAEGQALDDWLKAEAEIDTLLAAQSGG